MLLPLREFTMNGPILFVGNSPNQLSGGGRSWNDLMRSLREVAGVLPEGHNEKPFTLHFEELLISFRSQVRDKHPHEERRAIDLSFKEIIAAKMRALTHDDVHEQLMRLPVTNFLTTNYDFCLETALQPAVKPELADWGTNEKRYCLFFRRRAGPNKYVFHIHGEQARPESIMLGHEEYVESCSNIRRFSNMHVRDETGKWKPGMGNYYKGLGWLKAQYREGSGTLNLEKPHSWVDLFMLRDVHMVGFGLDFTEVDIWYLISYKARLKLQPEVPERLKKSRVVFHYFAEQEAKHLAKVELLRSLGVECRAHSITQIDDTRKDYRKAWKGLLQHLSNELSANAAKEAKA
jgi:SIR2-like protein